MGIFSKAFDKLKAGLAKTRQKFFGAIRMLVSGRQLDEDLMDELEATLIQADFGVASAMKIRQDLQAAFKDKRIGSGDDVIGFLKDELKKYWPPADRSLRISPTPPTVVLVAGINGAGKTTSVAKLAYQFKSEGKKVCLAAADTFRAAAVEQLDIWAKRIGVEIVKGSGSDPAAVVYDACDAAIGRKADILLVDTAGRLHTQETSCGS